MVNAKKHPSTRARTNKAATAASLPAEGPMREAPGLPARPDGSEWHPAVGEMWADVWASPMASEYVASDVHQLVVLAHLTHDFHTARTASGRREAAIEIRLQRQAFGLDPYARRRLEWSIVTTEDAKDRRTARKGAPPAKAPSVDPRAGLRVV